jgi:uncharacterized protein with beta-barrel porin domain
MTNTRVKSKFCTTAGAMALAAIPVVGSAQSVQTVANGNTLVTVQATAPGTVTRSVVVTGLGAGQTIAGIDYRPAAPRVLYAISNVGQLYTINARTGVATAVGTPPLPTISSVGFDFNPTVDRIRVVTQIGQNVRVNPDTGALAATDGALSYAPTDVRAGAIPTVASAAYTNNFAGATTTTLYVLDTRGGLAPVQLSTQGNATVSPNTGQLFTVGSTGVTSLGNSGFDIGSTGQAFATFTNPTTRVTSLYSINLTTGAATLLGALAGNATYEGLAVALASFASMGTTANQAAVGTALDGFTGTPTGSTLALLNAVDSVAGTPGAQADALVALSPAAYSLLPEISLNAVEISETNVLRYARDLRGNASMPDGSTATLDRAGRVGAWLLGGARFGNYDAAIDRPAVRTGEIHVIGGLDYRFAPAIALGVFGGYSQTDARLTPNSQQSKLKSAFVGGYGTASVGPFYLDAWGSYTDLDWDLRRAITIGSLSDATTATTRGRVYAAGASTGLSFDLAGFEVEPFAAVRYASIRINGFSEGGGSAAALIVSNIDRESIRSNAGLRVGADFEVGGATVRPQLHGSWYHEFRDRPQVISAAFINTGLSTTPFAFTGTSLGTDYYSAGATLNVAGNGPLSLVADYNVQFDIERELHALTIGARLAF